MKTRESGLPADAMWRSFFDPEAILTALRLTPEVRDAVDFGCGYGTFAVPAARRIRGTLHGFDIVPALIAKCERLARRSGVRNVRFHRRDFVAEGTGLADQSVDYAMLFNILHAEQPVRLLAEARRILAPGGLVAVIHWNYDPATPRGPSMAIRPRPADCRRWIEEAGFAVQGGIVDLPPHHYGLCGQKGASA
ncbi:MAG: methyltransferase type 11 [Lentisphaerae bacterium RIFOXYB12_FULL_65_16]|nr:MAG: methyltransferase type 11 [Lentisphaerae bacterium RIFOXYA12_64_32]OGV86632.1 MAG: methyltransferase type 11 [Lentisphaerae bacterium RIFOXYB12_FULL_65_16]